MEDDLLQRLTTLWRDEQSAGRSSGSERLLDRAATRDELFALLERRRRSPGTDRATRLLEPTVWRRATAAGRTRRSIDPWSLGPVLCLFIPRLHPRLAGFDVAHPWRRALHPRRLPFGMRTAGPRATEVARPAGPLASWPGATRARAELAGSAGTWPELARSARPRATGSWAGEAWRPRTGITFERPPAGLALGVLAAPRGLGTAQNRPDLAQRFRRRRSQCRVEVRHRAGRRARGSHHRLRRRRDSHPARRAVRRIHRRPRSAGARAVVPHRAAGGHHRVAAGRRRAAVGEVRHSSNCLQHPPALPVARVLDRDPELRQLVAKSVGAAQSRAARAASRSASSWQRPQAGPASRRGGSPRTRSRSRSTPSARAASAVESDRSAMRRFSSRTRSKSAASAPRR